MQMMKLIFSGLVLLLTATACGPRMTPPARGPCEDFAPDAERVWNVEVKNGVRTAFGKLGVEYAKTVSEKIITQMDTLTHDWVVVNERVCEECRVKESISPKVYAMRSACYDSVLIRLRSFVSFLLNADKQTAERAMYAFDQVSDRLIECQKEAVYNAYAEDVGNQNKDGLEDAEEKSAEAAVAFALTKKQEAEKAAAEGLVAAEKAGSHRLKVDALTLGGFADHQYGRYDVAENKFKQALETAETVNYAEGKANAYKGQGRVLNDRGRHQEALEFYEKAKQLFLATVGEESPQTAAGLSNIGLTWYFLRKYEKAIGYYEQALAIDRKAYGDQHPSNALRLNEIGLAWKSMEKYEKAIGYYEQALSIQRKAFGEEHPEVAASLNNIGMAWMSQGKYEKAIGYLEQALAIDRKAYGDQHPIVAIFLSNIGGAWYSQGKYEKALGYYEQSLEMFRMFHGDNHPNMRAFKRDVAACKEKLGQ